MGDIIRQAAAQLYVPDAARPIRYAKVISVQATSGTVTVRPSNASATDGTQDITVRFLTTVPPGVGAYVLLDVHAGDVTVIGAPGIDDFPAAPFAQASGSGTMPAPGAVPGTSTLAVTFPAGRFSQAPHVAATIESSTGVPAFAMVSAITTSGFTAIMYQVSGTASSRTLHWQAVQMTSTNASG